MAPVSTRKGLKNFQTGAHLAYHGPRMRAKRELRIEGDAEYLGVPFERNKGAI